MAHSNDSPARRRRRTLSSISFTVATCGKASSSVYCVTSGSPYRSKRSAASASSIFLSMSRLLDKTGNTLGMIMKRRDSAHDACEAWPIMAVRSPDRPGSQVRWFRREHIYRSGWHQQVRQGAPPLQFSTIRLRAPGEPDKWYGTRRQQDRGMRSENEASVTPEGVAPNDRAAMELSASFSSAIMEIAIISLKRSKWHDQDVAPLRIYPEIQVYKNGGRDGARRRQR